MEVLCVLVALLVVVALALTFLTKKRGNRSAKCQNNLKQVALSFLVWANDNNDKFPYYTTNCLAYANGSQAWLHFQTMSNELGSAAMLACPQDSARFTNWVSDFSNGPNGLLSKTNRAVSYFVGLEADEAFPNALLSGDRSLIALPEASSPSVIPVATNAAFRWRSEPHPHRANISLADGSVHDLDRLGLEAHLARSNGLATNRLLMPLVP